MREERAGIPEVILSAGKKPRDVIRLLKVLALKKGLAMATKAGRRCLAMASRENDGKLNIEVYYRGKVIVARRKDYSFPLPQALVGILAAGTADVRIAEEARITLQVLGCEAMVAYEVGVAGIHRLLQPLQEMKAKRIQVIIVVAGMGGSSIGGQRFGAGYRCAHLSGVRIWWWRSGRAHVHASVLLTGTGGGEHRQRLWRGRCCGPDGRERLGAGQRGRWKK